MREALLVEPNNATPLSPHHPQTMHTPASQVQDAIIATPDVSLRRKLLHEFFACAICQDIMSHPYTIVDCMHKFDKHCLMEFWKRNASCPLCKKAATKALHDFTLQGVVDSARPSDDPATPTDNAPIFPSPFISLGPNRGFGEDILATDEDMNDDWDDNEDMEGFGEDITARLFLPAHEPIRPGGDLIFPCDSCLPGNQTGYDCDYPIPIPSVDDISGEIQRTGRVIRQPQVGERRAPLSLGDHVPGVMAHLQCEGCTIYVPRQYPADIRCTVCRLVYCGQYTGKPNCGGISLHSADALVYKDNSIRDLALDSFPEYVRLNREEIDRFEAYVTSRNLTVSMILQQAVDAKAETFEPPEDEQFTMDSQGVSRDNPWIDAVLCTPCIETLVRVQSCAWEWWIEERKRGQLDPAVASLPDCWYGWECRTQTKSYPLPTHASKFNHVCPRIRRPTDGM